MTAFGKLIHGLDAGSFDDSLAVGFDNGFFSGDFGSIASRFDSTISCSLFEHTY